MERRERRGWEEEGTDSVSRWGGPGGTRWTKAVKQRAVAAAAAAAAAVAAGVVVKRVKAVALG